MRWIVLKYEKLKKKALSVSIKKAVVIKDAQGKRTYVKKKGAKEITVDKSTGKITVAKKTPTGTYKLVLKITAAGNKNYKKAAKSVTTKIIIR